MFPVLQLFNDLVRGDPSKNDQFLIGFPIGPDNGGVITDLDEQVYTTRDMMVRMMAVLICHLRPYSLFQGKYIKVVQVWNRFTLAYFIISSSKNY